MPRFYWDWDARSRRPEKDNTPFTPADSTIVALDDGAGAAARRGARARLRASRRARSRVPGGRQGDGSRALLARRRQRGGAHRRSLTPEGIDAVALRLALRDRHGITIAGGHGDIVDRLFRLGHIGHVGIVEVATALAAIELELGADGRDGRARAPPARPRARRTRAARSERCGSSSASRSPTPGVELLRSRFEVDDRRGDAARGDHRPLRRDRDPLGDEAHRRADRAGRPS